ncbi:hypothetical protein GPM19_04370 [Halomonas sp. ZH2S]|uniref:Uncharacterized protein n=1 Tax=Vreelandella zhuhanensis TaxID=2684210 RepID=A0A7X3KQZ4_9GAMM|nr:hypothetical protein [Halomonas zhuhanensis]MWJ27447.1 hypothetical protein [Halomonas zhuhanensis]
MTFISHAIEIALTRLTQQLLEQQTHQAVSLICAKGQFYRAEVRLVPIDPQALADHLPE